MCIHGDELHTLVRERGLDDDGQDAQESVQAGMLGLQTRASNCTGVLPVLLPYEVQLPQLHFCEEITHTRKPMRS